MVYVLWLNSCVRQGSVIILRDVHSQEIEQIHSLVHDSPLGGDANTHVDWDLEMDMVINRVTSDNHDSASYKPSLAPYV